MRETATHIYFYGGIYSNFYPCKIRFNNIEYISSEQLYMARKALYFKDTESFDKILKTTKPLDAKKIGRKVKNFKQEEWEIVRQQIMEEVLYLKFSQNLDLKKQILSTNKILVEASPYDDIWGIKLAVDDDRILNEASWQGKNLLGISLMNIRQELRKK